MAGVEDYEQLYPMDERERTSARKVARSCIDELIPTVMKIRQLHPGKTASAKLGVRRSRICVAELVPVISGVS